MQRRVAELTGIPVHADEAMAESGGRGKNSAENDEIFKFETYWSLIFLNVFINACYGLKLFFLKYVLSQQLI